MEYYWLIYGHVALIKFKFNLSRIPFSNSPKGLQQHMIKARWKVA